MTYVLLMTNMNQNKNDQQSIKNCALLNRAPPYFNMAPKKPTKDGTMKAMNEIIIFSNRGQKLTINVYNATKLNAQELNNNTLSATESINNEKNDSISAGIMAFYCGLHWAFY